MKKADIAISVVSVIYLLAALLVLSDNDRKAEAFQDRLYCKMVDLHATSHGVDGWPAYREGVDCNKVAKGER